MTYVELYSYNYRKIKTLISQLLWNIYQIYISILYTRSYSSPFKINESLLPTTLSKNGNIKVYKYTVMPVICSSRICVYATINR